MTRLLTTAATFGMLVLAACGATEGDGMPSIDGAKIRLPPPGMEMAAGYMTVRNPSAQSYRLTNLSSPVFNELEIHQTIAVDGVARMRELKSLEIPAGQEIQLKPGGMHLMLIGFNSDPRQAKNVPIKISLTGQDGTVQVFEPKFIVESSGD